MNRIYSLIFNRALRQLQVASEHAGRRRGGTVRRAAPPRAALAVTALSIGLALGVAPASAQVAPGQLPTGVISISGIGEISAFDDTMTISQVNRRAMIAWETFHVGRDARVVFDQLAGDIVLNRILDPDASQVLGRIDAPGTVFLINPNGIIFGEDAYINVGGLVASTLDMNASDFLGGGSFFYMTGSDDPAPVINRGTIVAGAGGVTIMAGHVGNSGLIEAELGSINLYGTETATLSLGAGGRVSVSLGTPVGDLVPGASAVVENTGTLEAGATVLMHAYTAADFAGTAVNTSGVIRATAINDVAGQVQLRSAGGGSVAVAGPIESAGQLAVDGQSISLSGNITSGGSQSYGGPVVLGLATLNSDFNINFASSVNGGWLTANAHQGTVMFGGALGNTTPLGGLNVKAGQLLAWSRLNVAGSLALDISQGGIAQSARWSVGGNASIAATNGNITLTTVGNDFAGRVSLYGNAVSIRDSNALQLDELSVTSLSATGSGTLDLGRGYIAGDLQAGSNGGSISQSGPLNVGGTALLDAGSGSVTLSNTNNDFAGPVTVTGSNIVLADRNDLWVSSLDNRGGPVRLDAGGTLTLPAAAIDTGAHDLELFSRDGSLETGGALTGANISLWGQHGIRMGHDASASGILRLDSAAHVTQTGGILAAGVLQASAEGSLTLGSWNALQALGTTDVSGHFLLRNTPAISQTAPGSIVVGGDATFESSGAITLASTGNRIGGEVSLTGGPVRIQSSGGLRLGALNVTTLEAEGRDFLGLGHGSIAGDLWARSHGGDIRQSGALAVGGSSTLDAGTGAIVLEHADNDFAGPVQLTSGHVFLRDHNSLTLAEVDVDWLDVTSAGQLHLGHGTVREHLHARSNGGNIVQSNTHGLTVGGTSNLDAGSGSIMLFQADNDLQGAVTATGAGIQLVDSGDLTIAGLNLVGDNSPLSLDARGTLSLPAQAIDTGMGSLTLASHGGSLVTRGALSGGSMILMGTGGMELGHNVSASTLSLHGGTGISQTGGALDAGTVHLATVGAATLGGENHIGALGNVHVDQDFMLRNVTGIEQAPGEWIAVFLGGNAWFDSDGAITLGNQLNEFGGTVNLSGEAVRIQSSGALQLGSLDVASLDAQSHGALDLGWGSIAGNLAAHSNGGRIRQSGGLAVSGTARVDAGSGSIMLSDTGNDFVGPVTAVGSGIVMFDPNDLSIASLTGPGGWVRLEAGGTLTLPAMAIDTGEHGLELRSFGGPLVTGGALSGSTVTLVGGDGLILGHDVTAEILQLGSGADIAQTAGTLTARLLQVEANGQAALGSWNTLEAVHTVDVGGDFLLRNSPAINQTAFGSIAVGGQSRFESGGLITLAGSDNDFRGAVSATGTMIVIADRELIAGTIAGTGDVRLRSYGDITLEGSVRGRNIDIASDGLFVNNAGAGALDAAESWRVYLANPHAEHRFGNLDSGNSAVWNTARFDPVTAPGNRYVFAYQPTLTFQSLDVSKVYGQVADLTGAYAVSGLMEGVIGAYSADTLGAVVTGTPVLHSAGASATATVAGGPYAISIDQGDLAVGATGYSLAFESRGSLTVNPATLTVTANSVAKTYGQTGSLDGFTVEGLLNDDAVTGANLASGGSVATATVGDYVITVDGATGSGLDNYDISYVDGVLTVGKAGLVIRANNAGKTYGQTGGPAGYAVEGLLNDDAVTGASLASGGSAATATVGDYVITVNDAIGDGLENYDISYVDGVLTVGKAGLVIRANNAGKTYGQTGGLAGYAVEGLLNDDAVTGANVASGGSAATATVGDYVISVDNASGTGLQNYDISYVDGVLTVGRAGLVIRASDAFKRMGEQIELEGYTVAGLVNDDRVTTVDLSSPGSAATAAPGGYAIIADNAVGTGLDNYEIQYLEGTLQVGVDPVPVTRAVSASFAPAPRIVPPAADPAGIRIEGEGLLMPPEAACRSLTPGSRDCPPHSPR